MEPPKDVDEYIAHAPKEVQPGLQELRATIKAAAPNAQERISYGMPYYQYKGRLVYFRLWPKHIGIYAITASVQNEYESELKGHVTGKGTLRFPLDEELPLDLISRLVKARVRENDAAASAKKK